MKLFPILFFLLCAITVAYLTICLNSIFYGAGTICIIASMIFLLTRKKINS